LLGLLLQSLIKRAIQTNKVSLHFSGNPPHQASGITSELPVIRPQYWCFFRLTACDTLLTYSRKEDGGYLGS